MADYGIGRQGGSLRDALNSIMPMTGMGEYNTAFPPMMFPPASGADQPTAAVPLPQPRPPMPPPGLAPAGMPPPGAMGQALPPRPGLGGGIPPGLAQAQIAGGLPPQSYAQRLGLGGPY